MHNRRHRLISPVRRNIVGRLCIRPTIVFLILSNQKARVRSLTSRRPFLCTYNMYQHQQLCVYKISPQKPTTAPISRKALRKFFKYQPSLQRLRGIFDEKIIQYLYFIKRHHSQSCMYSYLMRR